MEDLEQEVREAIFRAYLEVITNASSYLTYRETTIKYYGIKEDVTNNTEGAWRIIRGYLKTAAHWRLMHFVKKDTKDIKRATDLESAESEEGEDDGTLFEKVTAQTDAAIPEIDEQTRKDFFEYFGVRVPQDKEEQARMILTEEALRIMQEVQEKLAQEGGSGNYRKALPTAIENRRVAFEALFVHSQELKKAAEAANLDYGALKRTAYYLPTVLFNLRDKIVEAVKDRIARELGE